MAQTHLIGKKQTIQKDSSYHLTPAGNYSGVSEDSCHSGFWCRVPAGLSGSSMHFANLCPSSFFFFFFPKNVTVSLHFPTRSTLCSADVLLVDFWGWECGQWGNRIAGTWTWSCFYCALQMCAASPDSLLHAASCEAKLKGERATAAGLGLLAERWWALVVIMHGCCNSREWVQSSGDSVF